MKALAVVLVAGALLAACGTTTPDRTASGAAIGAGVGLLVFHISKPGSRWLALAGSNLKEHLLNLRGDFSALSVADVDAID